MKKIIIALAFIAALFFSACHKIDERPSTSITEERLTDHRFTIDYGTHKECVTFYGYDHKVGVLITEPGSFHAVCRYGTWSIVDGEIRIKDIVDPDFYVDDVFLEDSLEPARLYVKFRYSKYYKTFKEDATFDVTNDFWFPWNEYDPDRPNNIVW